MFLPRASLLCWIYDSFLPTIEFFRCVSVSLGEFSFSIKIFTKNKTHYFLQFSVVIVDVYLFLLFLSSACIVNYSLDLNAKASRS